MRHGYRWRLPVVVMMMVGIVCGIDTPVSNATPPSSPAYDLAGKCLTLTDSSGQRIGGGPLTAKAAALGEFLLYGTDAKVVDADASRGFVTSSVPSARSVWSIGRTGKTFRLSSVATSVSHNAVRISPVSGCRAFPEAELNVSGTPSSGTDSAGNVSGFVDSHAHLMASQYLGGELLCGKPYSPLGISAALRDCPDHQPAGIPAIGEMVLSRPGPHDTSGWPSFTGWPRWDSLTHQQTYYRWIERAWRSGLRMIQNYYVQNRILCERYPLRDQPCDEMESVRIQHRMLVGLQNYVDAQAGGPGKGFLRIVSTAADARRVIAAGKVAVTLGIEVSEPFGCRENGGSCSAADIDRSLNELNAMGIRQIILTHKFDNALGGTRFDQGTTGVAVNAGEVLATGHPWQTERCRTSQRDNPVVGYPRGQCNIRGLTSLGEYTVAGIIKRHMVIDVDHLSVKSATRVLDLVGAQHYPGVVSSHTWTDKTNYRRILTDGGIVGLFATPAQADPGETGRHGDMPPDFLSAWRVVRAQQSSNYYFGLGFGPDMGGLGKQAHPRSSARTSPVRYPYVSADGGSRISKQHTGTRYFDVNIDGTSHYGLLPDWIESLRIQAGPDGAAVVSDLFRAAEAYTRMWERVEAYRR
ncbi:sphingolipid ceramide N-deacylase [Gordonia sp. CPCC 205333]|uniref:sphingolipid ceramide N-deacylase n=1 Tax=Gordonia sp. CPCC 205333 TaxID=3140790 RepID=UPI003AF35B33